jgi:hypothetical protein
VLNFFVPTETSAAAFWIRMGVALLAAVIMIEIGTRWGDWMREIRR